MRPTATILALLAAAAPLAAPPAAAADDDPWQLLRRLRSRLESAPQQAEFEQHFLPAGFSSGERESGRLALALPDCLRWDYDEPDPRSYLLCGDTVWTWNHGEGSGRTFEIDADEERGLDLLRLGVARLAERYEAELVADGDGATIRLRPRGAAVGIVAASLELAPDGERLSGMSYEDVEGNVTRFSFTGYRPGGDDAPALEPPGDLTWIED